MAKDQSFDIVCKVDMPEVLNAVNQTTAEIKQRYDFKDTKTEVSLDIKSSLINILGQSEPQLKTIIDILQSKLIKRKVPIKVLQYGKPEVASGGMVRQSITLQQGIPSEKAKEIVQLTKKMKIKVQTSIQDNQVRVAGKKRDDLQNVMKMLKEHDLRIHMSFSNYR